MQKIVQSKWFGLLSLLIVILIGVYLRFTGINWDQNFHLHPDERFLTMVETSISSVDNYREYFDTDVSSLNPHNVTDINGNQTFPFFVYGTFPIFLVRYIAELVNQTGYSEIHIIGRYLSGIFDVGTIILTFLIAKKLFNSKWIGLLAASFYAFAPLPIQISHFFIVDNFTTFFAMFAILFAVRVMKYEQTRSIQLDNNESWRFLIKNWNGFVNYALFALTLGLATASKINAVAVAILLPLGVLLSNYQSSISLKNKRIQIVFRNLIIAGLLSFLFFRIFQPYAFSGPGFFDLSLNEKWLNNIKELQALSSGLSNYPPSLQWTRRSILFPLKNMLFWGIGPIQGLLAVAGLAMMLVRVLRGDWKKCGLLLLWNLLYISWQATRWNPTMRYFLLVYPTMAITAGWVIHEIGKRFLNNTGTSKTIKNFRWVTVSLVLITSFLWGNSFTDIYRNPMTRIVASEWIYKNIEGPINLHFVDRQEEFTQPIPYPKVYQPSTEKGLSFEVQLDDDFTASRLAFDHVKVDDIQGEGYLNISIKEKESGETIFQKNVLVNGILQDDSRGGEFIIDLQKQLSITKGTGYIITIHSTIPEGSIRFSGTISLINDLSGQISYRRIFEFSDPLESGEIYRHTFTPFESATVASVDLFRLRDGLIENSSGSISVEIIDNKTSHIIAEGSQKVSEKAFADYRGSYFVVELDDPVKLSKEKTYDLLLRQESNGVDYFINGSKTAKETDWDDALPLFMYGMNPFDNNSGVYQSDLNFQMYWEDNQDKLTRFISILDQTDYIIISSNRQWGSVTQAQEKYPLSTNLYRGLIDCGEKELQYCYIEAASLDSSGDLGFELYQTFHSQPVIFGTQINTQYAEEAFTVYDHPKVFIFKKSDQYAYSNALSYLSNTDLDKVINTPPDEIEKRPGLLELSVSRWRSQRQNGTWSDLFKRSSIQNDNQVVAVVLWYVGITLLGWVMYPLTRIVFRGLKYKGWGLSRLFGLLFLTYLTWITGSSGIHVTNTVIIYCLGVLILINGIVFLYQRNEIAQEIRDQRKSILIIESVTLVFFLVFLLIRLGNPDLWHPYKGGEKPMDFSYFNALIKSETFPPYDPWYAGGYINYYYWGFLLAAVPTRLLGIIPSLAYNLILPTFYSFAGIAAFCLGQNLATDREGQNESIIAGLIASTFILLIGNLGTIKMIFQGFQRLGSLSLPTNTDGIFSQISVFIRGIAEYIRRRQFNYYPGDWYWIPSRSIPGEPITEFPFFTFLYGDPHAHLFAYPITLLIINWAYSMIANKFKYRNYLEIGVALIAGALMVGSLRPTNTWDYPVFAGLSGFSIVYAFIKYGNNPRFILPNIKVKTKKILLAVIGVTILAIFSFILYQPYSHWYGQGYTTIALYEGNKTPIGSYLSHWGIFLFITVSWLIIEVIRWMKATPLSRLVEWQKQKAKIIIFAVVLVVFWAFLLLKEILISIIVIPVILVAFLLVFRKRIPEQKRFILLLTCVGYGLTLLVEIIVLSGDIGRMNTVFKFYLQAWTCIALSASYFLYEILTSSKNREGIMHRPAWRTILILLLFSGMLYPVFASIDKIADRMAENVPLTLDGMDFMQYAEYSENDYLMDLSLDHSLIRWMQENIEGTPTIIEASIPEYRWGSRVSIYTGLPGVIGWNWHQRQQRIINPSEWIYERVDDVGKFYSTIDISEAEAIIEKYEIDYVVIGQLEKAVYPSGGIAKFDQESGILFETVFMTTNTKLLKVNRSDD